MKPIKNKLAVTIVVLSVTFLSIIFMSVKNSSNSLSSGVGTIIIPLQMIVYTVNDKLKGTLGFVANLSKFKEEN